MHSVVAVGLEGAKKEFRVAAQVALQKNLAGVVENAEVHGAGVEIDAAVVLVLSGVKSHSVPSCEWVA